MFLTFWTKVVDPLVFLHCAAATMYTAEQFLGYFFVHSKSSYTIRRFWLVIYQTPAWLRPPEAFSSKPHIPIIALPGQVVSQFSAAGNPVSDRWADGQPGTPRRPLWMHPQYTWNLPHILLRSGKAIIALVLRPTYWRTPWRNLLPSVIFPTRSERTGLTFRWFISRSNFSSTTTPMRQANSEKNSAKSSGGFEGAASEPSTPAESQTGSVGSESGRPHLFAPLRPSPPAPSEEKSLFLRREQRSHK